MKKLIPIAIVAIVLSFTACDDIVPDIEKVVSESYTITIDAETPTKVGDTVLIDITQYQEYNDYKENISGYALNMVTYEIVEFDAPEDLYFTGEIIAYDTMMVKTITVGAISSTNLNDIYTIGEAQTMAQDTGVSNQLVAWLDDPGNFKVEYMFSLENGDGTDYVFAEEDYGSTVKIKVSFHLTIMTGLGGDGLDLGF